jgi:DNA-binding Lrp family transcriptional regulator
MGLVVRHHELGYRANALVAFDVPCARVDIVGERLAQAAPVTRCYRRTRRAPNWPYNLYCTVHGQDRVEVIGYVDELLGEKVRCLRRAVLFSRRRLHPRDDDGASDTVPPQFERPASGAAFEAPARAEGG